MICVLIYIYEYNATKNEVYGNFSFSTHLYQHVSCSFPAENIAKDRLYATIKSVQDHTCIKFRQLNLAAMNKSRAQNFMVVFSSFGNRYLLCNDSSLSETFQNSHDDHFFMHWQWWKRKTKRLFFVLYIVVYSKCKVAFLTSITVFVL